MRKRGRRRERREKVEREKNVREREMGEVGKERERKGEERDYACVEAAEGNSESILFLLLVGSGDALMADDRLSCQMVLRHL